MLNFDKVKMRFQIFFSVSDKFSPKIPLFRSFPVEQGKSPYGKNNNNDENMNINNTEDLIIQSRYPLTPVAYLGVRIQNSNSRNS